MRGRVFGALLVVLVLAPAACADAGGLPMPAAVPAHLAREVGASGIAVGGTRRPESSPPEPSFRLDTPGGPRVRVLRVGASVAVAIEARDEKSETAYLARGIASSRRLKASFGDLGEISMRFRPSRAEARRDGSRSCRGKNRYAVRHGVFVGTFRFGGHDEGFAVRVHRVAGEVKRLRPRCAGFHLFLRSASTSGAFFSPFSAPRELAARRRSGVDSAELFAFGSPRRISYLAVSDESRGSLATARIAFTKAAGRSLRINEALTSARVSPPAPFHGSATYAASPDGTVSWSGSLSFTVPGGHRVPLTGEGFETSVWRSF